MVSVDVMMSFCAKIYIFFNSNDAVTHSITVLPSMYSSFNIFYLYYKKTEIHLPAFILHVRPVSVV